METNHLPKDANAARAIIGVLGGIRPCAERIGKRHTTVQYWAEKGFIPRDARLCITSALAAAGAPFGEGAVDRAVLGADLGRRTIVQGSFDPTRPVRQQAADVERDLGHAGVPIERLLQRVDITHRTWRRWKSGENEPGFSVWVGALEAAQSLIELATIDDAHACQRASTGVA